MLKGASERPRCPVMGGRAAMGLRVSWVGGIVLRQELSPQDSQRSRAAWAIQIAHRLFVLCKAAPVETCDMLGSQQPGNLRAFPCSSREAGGWGGVSPGSGCPHRGHFSLPSTISHSHPGFWAHPSSLPAPRGSKPCSCLSKTTPRLPLPLPHRRLPPTGTGERLSRQRGLQLTFSSGHGSCPCHGFLPQTEQVPGTQ